MEACLALFPLTPLRILPWVLLVNALLVLAIVQRHAALEGSWRRYHMAVATLEQLGCGP
jgi:hypothetical protein